MVKVRSRPASQSPRPLCRLRGACGGLPCALLADVPSRLSPVFTWSCLFSSWVLCPPWILTSAPSRDTGPRAFHRLPLSSILPRAHPSDLSPVCQFSPSWTGFPLCASPRAGQASPCLCLRHVLPFTLRYPIHFQQSFAQSCFVPRSCWMG